MPFDKFQHTIEKTLARPVFTHEFGSFFYFFKKNYLKKKNFQH